VRSWKPSSNLLNCNCFPPSTSLTNNQTSIYILMCMTNYKESHVQGILDFYVPLIKIWALFFLECFDVDHNKYKFFIRIFNASINLIQVIEILIFMAIKCRCALSWMNCTCKFRFKLCALIQGNYVGLICVTWMNYWNVKIKWTSDSHISVI
jgi:hypothetical protein